MIALVPILLALAATASHIKREQWKDMHRFEKMLRDAGHDDRIFSPSHAAAGKDATGQPIRKPRSLKSKQTGSSKN